MTEKEKDRFIGECECIYSDDRENILVALSIAEAEYEGNNKEIERIKGAYQKVGIDPNAMIETNKGIIKRFAGTRRKVGNVKLCSE